MRQYIGARYVPIFFDNNGSTEWVGNHSYEPLTIVTYLGNSYTSKKLVTANIGDPASNPEYWASTGIYNSQVEQYREEVQELAGDVEDIDTRLETAEGKIDDLETDVDGVDTRLETAEGKIDDLETDVDALEDRMDDAEDDIDALESDVSVLKNRKILFIGDSYGTGSGGGYSVTPWINLVGNFLGLTENTSFWNYSRGGASFGANGGAESDPASGSNFCDLLRKAVNELSADVKSTITDICVGGAINDWSHNSTAISTGIGNFATLAKSQFPNAKITFCNICNTCIYEYKIKYYHDSIRYIVQSCGTNGIKFKRCDIDLLQDLNMFNADGIHPTQDGQNSIARRVTIALQDGDPNFTSLMRLINGTISGVSWCDGDNYYLKFTQSQRSLGDNAVTINSTWRKLDEFDALSFTGYDTNGGAIHKFEFTLPCCIKSGGSWTNGVLLLCDLRQSSTNMRKVELWVRQIGHFTDGSFTSFEATSLLPTSSIIVIPIWAA